MKLNTKGKLAHIKKILLDFIPAFLGVLAALLLNNWQQNARDAAFIHSSIKSIYNDCQKNLSIIKSQLKHIESHIDTINFYQTNNNLSIMDLLKKNEGLHIETIRNTGWKILEKSSLATNINYETLSVLYEIDHSIDFLNFFVKTFSDKIYGTIENRLPENKASCKMQLNDIYNSYSNLELNLIKLDSLVLKEYGKIIEK